MHKCDISYSLTSTIKQLCVKDSTVSRFQVLPMMARSWHNSQKFQFLKDKTNREELIDFVKSKLTNWFCFIHRARALSDNLLQFLRSCHR